MMQPKQYITMGNPMAKKFKTIEKNAKNTPHADIKDLQWEGEEVQAESTTKIGDDKGSGHAVIIRSFEFSANKDTFRQHKPTAQELFDSHMRGIESLLWRDGLKFYKDVEPRLIFSKGNTSYRFIIACLPSLGNTLVDTPQTLSQLLTT